MKKIKTSGYLTDLVLLFFLAVLALGAVFTTRPDYNMLFSFTSYEPETQTIPIYADPARNNETTAIVRIVVSNGEIIDFKPAFPLFIGVCENNKVFDSKSICVDMAKGSPIIKNELLGEIVVLPASDKGLTIEYIAGNGYYNGNTLSIVKYPIVYSEVRTETEAETARVAGATTSSSFSFLNFGNIIFITGIIFVFGMWGVFYVYLSRTQNKANRHVR